MVHTSRRDLEKVQLKFIDTSSKFGVGSMFTLPRRILTVAVFLRLARCVPDCRGEKRVHGNTEGALNNTCIIKINKFDFGEICAPVWLSPPLMLRAHRLSTRHHLARSWSTSILDLASKAENNPPQSLAKESLSPAAIVSLVHQHIAFRTKPWEIGEKQKERTALNTDHRASAHPVSAPGFVKPLGGRNTSSGLPLKRPPRIPTSTTADLEALADDLEAYAMMAAPSIDSLPRIYRRQSLRPRLLAILAHTQDAACAWAAYRSLLVLPRSAEKPAPKVPFAHRHRLLRLLAAATATAITAAPGAQLRTRGRGRFAQVFSVVRALYDAGGVVQRWEWNLLLDCAGKEGWRRPREEHFRAALAILAEMRARDGAGAGGGVGGATTSPAPDIFSYTTLLAHAVRTRSPTAVRHATRLLGRAGLTPGVHAHTTLLCFFAQRGDLAGVRDTLFRLRRHLQDNDDHGGGGGGDGDGSASGGGDGDGSASAGAGAGEGSGTGLRAGLTQASFNAVLWSFAYNGRLDVARAMYHVVRARAAEGGLDEEELEELEELERELVEREMIVIAPDVVPDAATYHTLIQAHAYQGDLRSCVETLTDMLSAPHLDDGTQPGKEGTGRGRQFAASLATFRAIFLGFARHGVTTTDDDEDRDKEEEKDAPQWTLPTLEALFDRFLDLPHDTPLREPTLFWLVSAFARTSGVDGHGTSLLLRSVFERVEARFGSSALKLTRGGDDAAIRRGRLARIRERVFSSPEPP